MWYYLEIITNNSYMHFPPSYEWVIPIGWMKSGEVQGAVWWLMEKEGVQ